jgi:hypothetical protein
MRGETREDVIDSGFFDGSTQPFRHNNENEG